MAKAKGEQPEGLRISTLAKVFEGSRAVEELIPMSKIGTLPLLAKRLVALSKNKDELTKLFLNLERVQQGAAELGDTALVRPTPHPLVERKSLPDFFRRPGDNEA